MLWSKTLQFIIKKLGKNEIKTLNKLDKWDE